MGEQVQKGGHTLTSENPKAPPRPTPDDLSVFCIYLPSPRRNVGGTQIHYTGKLGCFGGPVRTLGNYISQKYTVDI